MFIFANLINTAAYILDIALMILWWLILVRAIISWVNPDPRNPLVQFLYKTTEPILYPIRKMLPGSLKFGIDISPIIAFLIIMFLKSFLIRTLVDISLKLRGL
ncbi:MAG: YggT family protein [Candidatus Omnitrophica bacterium]|nr:YggT family protein [Candidatus Omnitrophota bacterium]